ncbi:MAG: IPT/TIG domain-containing protein, partial [bacterium]
MIGTKFVNTSSALCRFGSLTVPATVVSDTELECISPPIGGSVAVSVDFSVTWNGQEFASSGIAFQYLPDAFVLAVSPAFGPVSGGSLVTVFGGNFVDVPTLQCQFGSGSSPVVAKWL